MAEHQPRPRRILRRPVEEDEDAAERRAAAINQSMRQPVDEEGLMGDKSPKKSNSKKPGKSLKEKRADKHAKRDDKRPGLGS